MNNILLRILGKSTDKGIRKGLEDEIRSLEKRILSLDSARYFLQCECDNKNSESLQVAIKTLNTESAKLGSLKWEIKDFSGIK